MGFGNKCGKRVTIEMEVTAVGMFYNYNYFELLISVEILINTVLQIYNKMANQTDDTVKLHQVTT